MFFKVLFSFFCNLILFLLFVLWFFVMSFFIIFCFFKLVNGDGCISENFFYSFFFLKILSFFCKDGILIWKVFFNFMWFFDGMLYK